MKHQDEYRDPELARVQLQAISAAATGLDRAVTLMEVCGTHTMAVYQHGIRSLLPEQIRLVSGPGCQVCVTPVGYIDHAVALAGREDTIIATFGDMLKVPGSRSNLAAARARGGRIGCPPGCAVAESLPARRCRQRVPAPERRTGAARRRARGRRGAG